LKCSVLIFEKGAVSKLCKRGLFWVIVLIFIPAKNGF
jgi:hypothetical protein